MKPIYYFDVKLHVSTERFLTGRGPREDHGFGAPSIYSCVYYLFLGVPIICVSDDRKFEIKIRLFFLWKITMIMHSTNATHACMPISRTLSSWIQ